MEVAGPGNDCYTASTEEEKERLIMMIYYPQIIKIVRSTDILPHLTLLQDHFSELRMLDEAGKHVDSMMMLLSLLKANEQPNTWKHFVDALETTGYEDLYRALEHGEDFCSYENDVNYNLIVSCLPLLIDRIRLENSGILILLYQHRVISEHNLERINAYIRNWSNRDALLELIQHLHRKTKVWYTVFLEALLQDGHNELVDKIDPKFKLSRKGVTKFNFDTLEYDYLSDHKKTTSEYQKSQEENEYNDTKIKTDLCRIDIGKSVMVCVTFWNEKKKIHLRKFVLTDNNDMKPTKCGIALSVQQWKELLSVWKELSECVKKLIKKTFVEFKYNIGANVYVSVLSRYPGVSVRKFWCHPEGSDMKPTACGVHLNIQQWKKIEDNLTEINKFLPELSTATAGVH